MSWQEEDCRSRQGLRDYSICCYLWTYVNPTVLSDLSSLIWCFWIHHICSDCSKWKAWFFRTSFFWCRFPQSSLRLLIIHWSYSFGWSPLHLLSDGCTWHKFFSKFAIHKWSGTSEMMFQWCLLGGLSVGYYTSFPWMNWDMETQNKKGPFFNYHMKPLNYLGELWLIGSPIPSLSLRPPGYTWWGDKAFKDRWGRSGESTPSG